MTIIKDLKDRYNLAIGSVTGVYPPFSDLATKFDSGDTIFKLPEIASVQAKGSTVVEYKDLINKNIISKYTKVIPYSDGKMILSDENKVELYDDDNNVTQSFFHKIDSTDIDVMYDSLSKIILTYDSKTRQVFPIDVENDEYIYDIPSVIEVDGEIEYVSTFNGNAYFFTTDRDIYVYSLLKREMTSIIDMRSIPGENLISSEMNDGTITIASYTDNNIYISKLLIDMYNVITPITYTAENFTLENGVVGNDIKQVMSCSVNGLSITYFVTKDDKMFTRREVHTDVTLDEHTLYNTVSYEVSDLISAYNSETFTMSDRKIEMVMYEVYNSKLFKVDLAWNTVEIEDDTILLDSDIIFRGPLYRDLNDIATGIIYSSFDSVNNEYTLHVGGYSIQDGESPVELCKYSFTMSVAEYNSINVVDVESASLPLIEDTPLGCILIGDTNIIHPFNSGTTSIVKKEFRSPLDLSRLLEDGERLFDDIHAYRFNPDTSTIEVYMGGKNKILLGNITRDTDNESHVLIADIFEMMIDDSIANTHKPIITCVMSDIDEVITYESSSTINYSRDFTPNNDSNIIDIKEMFITSNKYFEVDDIAVTNCTIGFNVIIDSNIVKSLYSLSLDMNSSTLRPRPTYSKEIFNVTDDLYAFCDQDKASSIRSVEPVFITNVIPTTSEPSFDNIDKRYPLGKICYQSNPDNITGVRQNGNVYRLSFENSNSTQNAVMVLDPDEVLKHVDLRPTLLTIFTNKGVYNIELYGTMFSIPVFTNGIKTDMYLETGKTYATVGKYDNKPIIDVLIASFLRPDSYLMQHIGFGEETICNKTMMETILGFIKEEIVGDITVDKYGSITKIKGYAHVNDEFQARME